LFILMVVSVATSMVNWIVLTAPAGLAVDDGVAGLVEDFTGAGVVDAFAEVGLAAEDVGLMTVDEDLLPPGVPELPSARILAAACSAKVTM
jgi:hypothetical protein